MDGVLAFNVDEVLETTIAVCKAKRSKQIATMKTWVLEEGDGIPWMNHWKELVFMY